MNKWANKWKEENKWAEIIRQTEWIEKWKPIMAKKRKEEELREAIREIISQKAEEKGKEIVRRLVTEIIICKIRGKDAEGYVEMIKRIIDVFGSSIVREFTDVVDKNRMISEELKKEIKKLVLEDII